MQYTYRKLRWMTIITQQDTSCFISQHMGIIRWIKAFIEFSSWYTIEAIEIKAGWYEPFCLWVKTNRVNICSNFPPRMMNLLLYIPAGFRIPGWGHIWNHSLICCSYLQLTLPQPHAYNKYKNKQTHTRGKPLGTSARGLPLISAELYIFHIRNETQH